MNTLLLGHKQFDSDARVVKHEHHVIAGWKFFDELKGGGEAGGIEADASETVLQNVEADLCLDGFDGVPGFDY